MMKRSRFLAVLAAGAAAQGQQRSADPALELPAGVRLERDVIYAQVGQTALALDLFLPKPGKDLAPGIVYVHGGGWWGGNKNQFHRQAARMAAEGFVGACLQYRLSGQAKYPAALEDVKAGVRWLRANAGQYGVRAERIGAAGGSAGGHLVALLGLTNGNPSYEGRVGVTGVSGAVQAVAAFNPALDIVAFGRAAENNANHSVVRFLGKTYEQDPELYRAASPLEQVNPGAPPFLLLHGTADSTVPYKQSEEFEKALRAQGVPVELVSAPEAEHGFFNRAPWFEPMLARMLAFFQRTLR